MITTLPFPLRAPSEQLPRAAAAREHDDVEHGAVGAGGWGFALANAIETELVSEGGAKLANLGARIDPAWGLARALTLTGGWMWARGHVEELFSLSLYAVDGGGQRYRLSFYAGPSGLALGSILVLDEAFRMSPAFRELPERLAAAWHAALTKVPPTAVSQKVKSDFGLVKVAAAGTPAPNGPYLLPLPDGATWKEVCKTAREAADAQVDGLAAVEAMAPVLAHLAAFLPGPREKRRRAVTSWLGGLWVRAFAYVEANLPVWEGAGAEAMPAAVDLLGRTICCPQDDAVYRELGRHRIAAVSEWMFRR